MASNNRSKAAKAVLSGDKATLLTELVKAGDKASRAAYKDAIRGAADASIHVSATDDLKVRAFKQAILPLINSFGSDALIRARVVRLILDDVGSDSSREAVVLVKALAVFVEDINPVVSGVGPVTDNGSTLKVRETKGKLPVRVTRTDALDLLRAWAKLDKTFFHGTTMAARFLSTMVKVTGADHAEVAAAAEVVSA